MKKPYYLLALAVLVAAGLTFGALQLTKSSPKKTSAAKTPGVAVNLIACANGQNGIECLALYKGQCAVFIFNPMSGQLSGAQPVEARYCAKS